MRLRDSSQFRIICILMLLFSSFFYYIVSYSQQDTTQDQILLYDNNRILLHYMQRIVGYDSSCQFMSLYALQCSIHQDMILTALQSMLCHYMSLYSKHLHSMRDSTLYVTIRDAGYPIYRKSHIGGPCASWYIYFKEKDFFIIGIIILLSF